MKNIINKIINWINNSDHKIKIYVIFAFVIIFAGVSFLSYAYFNTKITGNDTSVEDQFIIKPVLEEAHDGALTIIEKAPNNTGTINAEGLMKIEQPETDQTPEFTEYRYSGSDVKNYVTFNGEIWRIIGIFNVQNNNGKYEQRIKIVKENSIGNYSWDSSISSLNNGFGINQWGRSKYEDSTSYEGADLMKELNEYYLNSEIGTCYNGLNDSNISCDFETTGLKEASRSMVESAKWYLSTAYELDATSSMLHANERSKNVGNNDDGTTSLLTKTSSWFGNIGLIYPSDYGYASDKCFNDTALRKDSGMDYSLDSCKTNNWLYDGTSYWTISPKNETTDKVLIVNEEGSIVATETYHDLKVRPVVYLKSDINITGGSGTSSDPYILE